jgi:hypothetical protein
MLALPPSSDGWKGYLLCATTTTTLLYHYCYCYCYYYYYVSLVYMHLSNGPTEYICFPSTWRWRYNLPLKYHTIFLSTQWALSKENTPMIATIELWSSIYSVNKQYWKKMFTYNSSIHSTMLHFDIIQLNKIAFTLLKHIFTVAICYSFQCNFNPRTERYEKSRPMKRNTTCPFYWVDKWMFCKIT